MFRCARTAGTVRNALYGLTVVAPCRSLSGLMRARVSVATVCARVSVATVCASVAWLGLVSTAWAEQSDAESSLAKARAQYDEHTARIEKTARRARSEAVRLYENTLERLADSYQRSGALENLLAVRREQERFKQDGGLPDSATSEAPALLASVQQKARKALSDADGTAARSVVELTEKYLAHLDRLKRSLTRAGNMADAVVVRDEIESIRKKPTYTSALFEQAERAVAASEARSSTPAGRQARATDLAVWSWKAGAGTLSRAGPFETEGEARVTAAGLEIGGGRIMVKAFDGASVKRIRTANALTLEAEFRTAGLDQGGPARIVSCSYDGSVRNFSLCQEGPSLVLRLRTTDTGRNGTSPSVKLGRIAADRAHRVVVSYRPGELVCVLDDERQEVRQITGDFSNWDDSYPLVLGNEYKDKRPWHGTITRVRIDSTFTKPQPEASGRTAAASRRG